MTILSTLQNVFKLKTTAPKTGSGGGGQLAPQAPPKVKSGQASIPGFATSIKASTAVIPRPDLNSANVDITNTYRFGADTCTTIRNLAQVTPDLSAAVSAHLRLGIPERYFGIAENPDGSFNLEATQYCMELLRRWANAPNYDTGFSQTDTLRSVAEACGKEGVLYGGMMLELVLDKARAPLELSPISVTQIKWYPDDKGQRPVQIVGGEEVNLDFPTVFYVALDASILDAYSQSPMEPAIQSVLAASQFLTDLRRLCARHVYPRYDITIDDEKLRKNIPEETKADNNKLNTYLNDIFSSAEDMVTNLGVEEAMLHYDFITVTYVEGNDQDMPGTFEVVKDIHDAKVATGAKSLPAILGHGAGSQNVASTETMLAMMTANSMVRLKLMELFSRALTMACRLGGHEVTVSFEYETIDMRPDAELEAFKTMKMERLLRLVSLGMMTDEEACLRLTYKLPPPGYVAKMGTGFDVATSSSAQNNPYSGTGNGGGQSGGGATNQNQKAKTPKQSKGPSK